ncbi:MAG TPA: hypothetical protein VGI91_12195 [Steroidobacteraceae bacterium]|jgi:hypothetical protein
MAGETGMTCGANLAVVAGRPALRERGKLCGTPRADIRCGRAVMREQHAQVPR